MVISHTAGLEECVRVVIVGGGIFGVVGACTLGHRGHAVTLLDPGPVPHPLAESTDITKAVRLDYGSDDAYLALMEEALPRWRLWNARSPRPYFHETGVAFLSAGPMVEGTFEHASFNRLGARGLAVERLDADAIVARFPAWRRGAMTDGYFNPQGGYAESGAVVAWLLDEATQIGVAVRGNVRVRGVRERNGRVDGVETDGGTVDADCVVVAAGAWTPDILPSLGPSFRTLGQPVFHLRPRDPSLFEARHFPVFGADISRSGWYGFPLVGGVVKVANHGPGRPMHPGDSGARVVTVEEMDKLRAFLTDTFPSLVDAELVHTRVCVYGDTHDEHFWIDADPERAGLVVAAGGSGHGFKFAPVLGDIIADVVEGRPNPWRSKFRWRPEVRAVPGEEEARAR